MRKIELKELVDLGGQEVGVSDWLEITQERVNKFAEATNDFQWIHVDVERATREMGGTIVHGYLTASLIPLLDDMIMEVLGVGRRLNYGSDKVRFVSIAPVGKRIRLRTTILNVEPKSGGLLVKKESAVEIEGETKPACIAETLTLYFAS